MPPYSVKTEQCEQGQIEYYAAADGRGSYQLNKAVEIPTMLCMVDSSFFFHSRYKLYLCCSVLQFNSYDLVVLAS